MAVSRKNSALEAEIFPKWRLNPLWWKSLEKQAKQQLQKARGLTIYMKKSLWGFKKDPRDHILKMQTQYPLEEVDLGDGAIWRITYINTKIDNKMKDQVIEFLKDF